MQCAVRLFGRRPHGFARFRVEEVDSAVVLVVTLPPAHVALKSQRAISRLTIGAVRGAVCVEGLFFNGFFNGLFFNLLGRRLVPGLGLVLTSSCLTKKSYGRLRVVSARAEYGVGWVSARQAALVVHSFDEP